jgi:FkbM family methyltransferase
MKLVEGSATLCQALYRRVGRQCKSLFQVEIVNGLIGKRNGAGVLYEFDDHGLNSVSRKNGKRNEVSFVNLSEKYEDISRIDLVKCDIEGSELEFLKNYHDLLLKARSVVIEFHPELCDQKECERILKSMGFTLHELIRDYGGCSVHLFVKPEYEEILNIARTFDRKVSHE